MLGDPASWCAVMLAVVSVLPADREGSSMLYKHFCSNCGELQRFYRDIRPTKETWCCVDKSRTAAAEADAAATLARGIEMRSSSRRARSMITPLLSMPVTAGVCG